jgi:hypothetical protein
MLAMYVRQDTRKHCVSQQLLANFCLQGVETFGSMRGELQRDVGYGSATLTRLPGTSAAYSQLRTPSALRHDGQTTVTEIGWP